LSAASKDAVASMWAPPVTDALIDEIATAGPRPWPVLGSVSKALRV